MEYVPSINKMNNKLSSLDIRRASNMLRCDVPSKENIDKYQQLAKENENEKFLKNAISDYMHSIENESSINLKTHLFTVSDSNTQTKAYLVTLKE